MQKLFFITILVLVSPICAFTQVQGEGFGVSVGLGYAPRTWTATTNFRASLIESSMAPTVDIIAGDNITSVALRLGMVSSLDVVMGADRYYFAVGYAYATGVPQELAHNVQIGFGLRADIGKKKNYRFEFGLRLASAIKDGRVSLGPVIGLNQRIE